MQYNKYDSNDNLTDSESLKCKARIIENIRAAGNTKDFEIVAPLNYLSNFFRTQKMPLINYQINLLLIWSASCFITNLTSTRTFTITYTKIYVSMVTLSSQNSRTLIQNLKLVYKQTNSWNKWQSQVTTNTQS